MNNLLNALETNANETLTTNGAGAFRSTTSEVLDFFASGGAIREWSAQDQISLFEKAWNEDQLLALKTMFYMRDIRGGQGQREAFRRQLAALAESNPDTVRKNLELIPLFGRWDDLYVLVGSKVEKDVAALINKQVRQDIASESPTLLGKWLKSENASSAETKRLGTWTRTVLNLTSKQYRKILTALRAKINIVETKISQGEWSDVNYSQLPSKAMMKYRKAFAKRDTERFNDFVNKVSKGEVTMNSGTLYPHEIIEKIGVFSYGFGSRGTNIDPQLAQGMWDNLPDYLEGREDNAICMVDTSGSMSGTPINVAVALGMYFAERNEGAFKDRFISFSDRPTFQTITGRDIVTKVRKIGETPWGYNTNLQAAYQLILDAAVKSNASQSEMPSKLIIISDMQFDCVGNSSQTLYQNMRQKFHAAGYEIPQVVFWNVNANQNSQPVTKHEINTTLVSGWSPSTFTYVMGEAKTPYDLMMEVIGSERYAGLEV